jgi:hypothetical protein
MRNDFHDNDPRTIWQNQSTEVSRVSLVLIRQKTRQLHARRFRQLADSLVTPLVIVVFYVFCVREFAHLRQVLNPLFAFVLAWSVAGFYFLNRGKRLRGMPADAGFSTGLQFCREELERQRDYIRRALLWSFGPIVMALGTLILTFVLIAGREFFARAMPLTALAVAWIAAYLVIRVQQQRKLQREIDELRDVERENSR